MIKYLFYTVLFMVFTFTSCKTKNKATQTETKTTCKVLITFASRGSGIDYVKYDKLSALLNEKKLKFTEKVIGREGEKEICIPLTELKGDEKTKFAEQLKTFHNEASFISVSIN